MILGYTTPPGRKDMMEYIWVLTILVVLTGKFAQGFEYEVSSEERFIFGEVTTFMRTDSDVFHMAADEYIPGNILFSDSSSLKTTDGITTTNITGSPESSGYQNGTEFRYITGFLQVTPNEVIINDYANHCIRWLDRRNASVSDFAGKCEEGGYVDGMGTTARFRNPSSVIRDTRNTNQVIISDRFNNALRVLDVKTASVSTLLKSDTLYRPHSLTYDPTDEDTLIITTQYGIQKFSLPVMSREDISGGSGNSGYGFKDGSLKEARYKHCEGIIPLHDQIYILSDSESNRLRVLDLLNDKVSSICTGIEDHLDGPVSKCQLSRPVSLLLFGNNLYIGTQSRIRSLPVSLEKIIVANAWRLTFGEMTTFMETDWIVYHMAADEYIPGNILFSDSSSLKTTDGTATTTITGSPLSSGYKNGIGVHAYFSYITDFVQVTPNEIIIIDSFNNCIRWLDRRNASVSDFAGKCEQGGYVDGIGTTARFQHPFSAIRDTRNTNNIIISDRENNALRVLDVKTSSVSTLLKSSSLDYPRAFTYDPTDGDALIITTYYGIKRLFLPVMSREDISGGSVVDFKDGRLKEARYNSCTEILPLHDQIYIVGDFANHRLRVLDLVNGKVSSICTGTADHLDGPVSECQLEYPQSLLLIGNNLYIGTLTRIRLLPVSLEKIKVANTTTTVTTTTTTTTPAEPLPGKDNTLVIGVAVPLSGLFICAVIAFIACAIRKRRNITTRTQSTSNVCAADPSLLNNSNSGALQVQLGVDNSSENEMFSLNERPPSYNLHYEDPVPSTLALPAPSPYLPPCAPKANPEHVYEVMDLHHP